MIDIEAIRKRAEAATEGPWEPKNWTHVVSNEFYIASMERGPLEAVRADSDFIAHARQDIPALLEALAAQVHANEVLISALEEVKKELSGNHCNGCGESRGGELADMCDLCGASIHAEEIISIALKSSPRLGEKETRP